MKSIIFWKLADAPLHQDQSVPANAEFTAVWHYLENSLVCRRIQLLHHFHPDLRS